MAKSSLQPKHEHTFRIIVILTVLVILGPTVFLPLAFRVYFFFPAYTIACAIYALMMIAIVKRMNLNAFGIPKPLLLFIIFLKLCVIQVILLFLFTPLLGFFILNLGWLKFCLDMKYFVDHGTPMNPVFELCKRNELFSTILNSLVK